MRYDVQTCSVGINVRIIENKMLRSNGNIECSIDRRPDSASEHSSSSGAEVKNVWSFTSTSHRFSTLSAQREFDALLLPCIDIHKIVLWGWGEVQKERLQWHVYNEGSNLKNGAW